MGGVMSRMGLVGWDLSSRTHLSGLLSSLLFARSKRSSLIKTTTR